MPPLVLDLCIITVLQPYTANANLGALLQPETGLTQRPAADYFAEPQPDWVDFVYDSLMMVGKTLLCLVGILERKTVPASSVTSSRTKTVYQVSVKGLANAIVLGAVVTFLYLSGFRIYFW